MQVRTDSVSETKAIPQAQTIDGEEPEVIPGKRYELVEKLAAGSFATVYRAKDLELGRDVAVKQIHPHFLEDPSQLDRYWQEAQLLASLQHPNIVTIYDIVRDKGWLIMELMQTNLQLRQSGRPMDLSALRTTVAHSLRALKFLHEHGVIHGDIKPGNMMVDRRKRVKIGDFGLARRASDDDGSLLKGTTKYMAPELLSDDFGEIGGASDLYSLGFSAYELMCGKNFEDLFPGMNQFGRDKQVAWMMWHAAPDRRLPEIQRVLEGVPEDLAHVIQKLTAKSQSERYRTADEALADLKLDIKVVRTADDADDAPVEDPEAKRKRLLTIGAFAVSVVLSLGMLFMPSGKTDPREAALGRTGIVREVLPDEGKFVLLDEESRIPDEIDVGARPRIFLRNNQQNILLRELRSGDRIRIERDDSESGNRGVRFVVSRPVTSIGRIRRADPLTNVVVIQIENGPFRGELPIRIPKLEPDQVLLNGQPASVKELENGDQIEVEHLADLKDDSQQFAITLHARRIVRLTGFVQNFDPSTRKLSVEIRQGMTRRVVAFPVADDCKIVTAESKDLKGAELESGDLMRGDRVVLQHDTDIRELMAQRNQHLKGVVQEVRESEKIVIVSTSDGVNHPYLINDDTEVEVGGETGRFLDLRKYDEVRVTFLGGDSGAEGVQTVSIDATRPARYDRLAIVIGGQDYRDKSLFRPPFSLQDCRMLEETLLKRYGVPRERLLMLTDRTRAEIERSIGPVLQQSLAQTQVFVFFSGQGFLGEDKEVYLAGRDFDPAEFSQTGLPLRWLIEKLDACAALDKLLILDSWQANSESRSHLSAVEMLEALGGAEKLPPLKSTAVIASCRAGELGLPWKEKEHGLFAWHLAQGYGGPADSNRDLLITPVELFGYLHRELDQAKAPDGKIQTPTLFMPAQ